METLTVLIFHRGNWCRLCMAQIKEPRDHFDAPFDFLIDPGSQAARQLGIASSTCIPTGMQVLDYSTETVMPTVVITDAKRADPPPR